MRATTVDTPVVRFVNAVLNNSVERRATRVRFELRPKSVRKFVKRIEDSADFNNVGSHTEQRETQHRFIVSMEIDGRIEEVAQPPVVLWDKTISRLKVMARMVDYGPTKSENGCLEPPLEIGEIARFFMTSNPNPSTDKVVILEREC